MRNVLLFNPAPQGRLCQFKIFPLSLSACDSINQIMRTNWKLDRITRKLSPRLLVWYIFNFQRRWEDKQRQKEIDFSYVLLCWRKQVFMFLTSLVLKILQENFNICRQEKIITSIFATEKKIWLQYFPLRFPLAQLVCQLHCFKWSTKEWDWDLKHICWEKNNSAPKESKASLNGNSFF